MDTRAASATWHLGGLDLTERVARHDKAEIRRRVIRGLRGAGTRAGGRAAGGGPRHDTAERRRRVSRRLRDAVTRAGGLWARLAPFPYPYRSAFNFRADLDEPFPGDYARFAKARGPLLTCTHTLE